MRNFIGEILLILADFISMCHKMLLILLVAGIFVGLITVTMIALMSLLSGEYYTWSIEKWYWNLSIFLFGGSVFVLTFKRLLNEKTSKL